MDISRCSHALLSITVLVCLVIPSTAAKLADTTNPTSADASTVDGRRTYIIPVRPPAIFSEETSDFDLHNWYESFLPLTPSTAESKNLGSPSLVHAYSAATIGFAAKLTEAEAAAVARKDGVLAVYPDRVLRLHTTRTPDFLGLRGTASKNGHGGGGAWDGAASRMGEGVIIAILDTMVNLKHVSFRDDGMSAPPSKWRGNCSLSANAGPCNKKVIGGTAIFPGVEVELEDGHGTHTASTAAGNFVAGASVLGSGNGTAAGMAPRAHLAVYEVCNVNGCDTSKVVAAMDRAIADGADILSMSLGSDQATPIYGDPVAIAAFNAMRKVVLVICSAGNQGPGSGTVTNDQPWVMTVGASTTDRRMPAVVKLGDGRAFVGESAYQPKSLPATGLVKLPQGDNAFYADCYPTMVGVDGKLAICEHIFGDMVYTGLYVRQEGGAGMLLVDQLGHTTLALPHVLPASYVAYPDGAEIKTYLNKTKNPVAEVISSRGPSRTRDLAFRSQLFCP